MTHGVFDVVSKDPQVQHVAYEMHETPVQEHAGDETERGWNGLNV